MNARLRLGTAMFGRRPRIERRARIRSRGYRVELLEGRIVFSHAFTAPGNVAALINIPGSTSGEGAILAALRGGPGSEFVTLLKREVPNYLGVIEQFAAGVRTQFAAPGFAARQPQFQSLYTGPHLDQMAPTVAGALLLKGGKTLELGAIMRGPIHVPEATTYVFGMNRGAAPATGPFSDAPGITFDATVSVTVTPNRNKVVVDSATVNDLVSGSSAALPASDVKVNGPVIRVYAPMSLLPSQGLAPTKYQFAFWTQFGSGGIETICGFVPPSSSIPIGVQPGQPKANKAM